MPAATVLTQRLEEHILLLDGAYGTMLQALGLDEPDYRGSVFEDHPAPLKGNYDALNLSRPELVADVHRAYLDAGADIIKTNSFNSTRIAQSDYELVDRAAELNAAAARIARQCADEFAATDWPRFVAGVLGPTNRTASLSPDVNDPGFRNVTFEELQENYYEAAEALLNNGADLLLLETVFDTLNAKAAIFAIKQLGEKRVATVPLIVSGTITDASGRTLSGQTCEAFWASVNHAEPLAVGLNCALGADQLRAYVARLGRVADTFISVHPNAGLPNAFGGYDEAPETTASILRGFAEEGMINLAGGCCGTRPEHIAAIAKALEGMPPRPVPAWRSLCRASSSDRASSASRSST